MKDALDKSSEINRTLGITFVLFLFYIATNVLSTTDLMLFVPDTKINLPIINLDLPILTYYFVTPFLILTFHYNLIFNMQQHSIKLENWDISIKNDSPKTHRLTLNPFLFNYLTTPLNKWIYLILKFVIYITTFIFPFLLLIEIQRRFAPYHHWSMTTYHFCIVILDFLLMNYHTRKISNILSTKKYIRKNKSVLSKFLQIGFSPIRYGMLVFSIILYFFFIITMSDIYSNNFFTKYQVLFPYLDLSGEKLVKSEPENEIIKLYISDNYNNEKINDLKIEFTKGYDLRKRDFRLAIFKNVTLTNAILDSVNLNNCDFSNAELFGVSFINAKLYNCNFTECQMQRVNLENAKLHDSEFIYTDLTLSSLKNANLSFTTHTKSIFKGTFMKGAIFIGSEIDLSNFNGAYLRGAEFIGANIKSSNFIGSILDNSCFSASMIENTNFSFSEFNSTDFQASKLSGLTLNGAFFNNPLFYGADTNNKEFLNSNLQIDTIKILGLYKIANIDSMLYDKKKIENYIKSKVHKIRNNSLYNEFIERLLVANSRYKEALNINNYSSELQLVYLDSMIIKEKREIAKKDLFVAQGILYPKYSENYVKDNRTEDIYNSLDSISKMKITKRINILNKMSSSYRK